MSSSSSSSSSELRSRVNISLELRNLPRMDLLSKSDPFIVLSQKQTSSNNYYELGRTETIDNNENPVFAKTFEIDYFFEELQVLKFDIYDSDSNSQNLQDHDYIGFIDKPLSFFLAMNHRPLSLMDKTGAAIMVHGKPCQIIIHIEEIKSSSLQLSLKIHGEKLDKKDWFGKSDPYLQFYRQRDIVTNRSATASSRSLTSNGSGAIEWAKVFETEVIKNTLDPSWKPFLINIGDLCSADFRKEILIRCWDWNSSGKSDLIGEFLCTLEELTGLKGPEEAVPLASLNKGRRGGGINGKRSFPLKLFNKKGKDAEKTHGTIIIDEISFLLEPSFLDYIKGGMQISLITGIDFTGSNGHPDDEGSLHYRKSHRYNPYQSAIECIGNILSPYDSDQKFPVFGFGADIGSGAVSHCFPLSFDPNNVEVIGVAGIMNAYKNALNRINFSGPTLFAPLIDATINIASSTPFNDHNQGYYILLIITDGVINDMPQTIRSIIKAAKLPISIVIVGVGNADFSAMKILDGDDIPLESEGEKVCRDIVQFVAMREFSNKPIAALAKETLAEIPQQILSFAKIKGITPMKPSMIPPSYGDNDFNNNNNINNNNNAPVYGNPPPLGYAMSSSMMIDQPPPPAYAKSV